MCTLSSGPREGAVRGGRHIGPTGAPGALLGVRVARMPAAQREMKFSETWDLWATELVGVGAPGFQREEELRG